MCFGCSDKVQKVKKTNGESKTYNFFKKLDTNDYYISFYDRNTNQNDDTKIIMAKAQDRYYYEIDGTAHKAIIQKEGYKYNIDYQNKTYSKKQSEIEDYSDGIIPKDVDKLKTESYEKGREKIYSKTYDYEKYQNTKYYFNGKKLTYVKYTNVQRTVFLKYDDMKKDYDKNIFEIDEDLKEITY